jgi:hypothetical protein
LTEGLVAISNKEGIPRLFKSSKIYFACKTLYTAIQFQSFEMINYYFEKSTFNILLNTVLSTAVATTILNPLEVLITRYALVDTTKSPLVFSKMAKRIFHKEGLAGFYKGYGTELVYHCVYALFWIPLYQILRDSYGVELHE